MERGEKGSKAGQTAWDLYPEREQPLLARVSLRLRRDSGVYVLFAILPNAFVYPCEITSNSKRSHAFRLHRKSVGVGSFLLTYFKYK